MKNLGHFKDVFQELANDTDLVTMRVNGRTYQFNDDGTVIVVSGLKKVPFNFDLFKNDYLYLSFIIGEVFKNVE